MAYNCKRAPVIFSNLSRYFCSKSTDASVSALLEKTRARFENLSIPEPELSSKHILSHVLGSSKPSGFVNYLNESLSGEQMKEFERMVNCRVARVPVQYIVGSWDFREISLQVRPPVFIPRPETEQLVELVLDHLRTSSKEFRILEIGPGSGNICLSLLKEHNNVRVTALERSKLAADLTKENAKMLGLESRLNLLETKVENYTDTTAKFDVIVSNPPYVLRKDLMALQPEICLYEDLRALDGGAEGLDTILSIIKVAEHCLDDGGRLFLEVDPCHPHILPPRLLEIGSTFHIARTIKDFRDKDRFVELCRH